MKKRISISVVGALGRMGKIICKKIINHPNLTLASVVDKKKKKIFNKITEINSLSAFNNCDVIIDFSNPEGTMEVLKLLKNKKKIIIGTTGFNKSQEEKIKKYSKKYPILKSGNMSIGINLMTYISEELSKKISNEFQINIYDNHHKKKTDYPSGTALMLAKSIASGKNKKFEKIKGNVHLNKNGKNKKNKINFYVTRKGKTIGEHSIKFFNNFEILNIRHLAKTRDLFAEGAINAIFWIIKKKSGYFSMRDFLNL